MSMSDVERNDRDERIRATFALCGFTSVRTNGGYLVRLPDGAWWRGGPMMGALGDDGSYAPYRWLSQLLMMEMCLKEQGIEIDVGDAQPTL